MARLDDKPKYSLTQFNAAFIRLVTYFRAKITKEISEMYYYRLKSYPVEALIWAIDRQISDCKPTTANFPPPSDLANQCEVWLKDKPDVRRQITVYDSIEDSDYPLDVLFDALKVLERQGERDFMAFATAQKMPKNDIKRVMDKHKYNVNPEYKQWVKGAAKRVRDKMRNFSELEELPF